ncbi:hypothetical protein DSO57_1032594 [Entomophthora muscae]|uniref:Uncharacterized protein n=1 Tax=Entomophthora muscae TaxID=34485 RepID=A0ACC2U9C5_9FUNG|nr:hypothetical protein DSO57_1032594 [Entomophthora muscae]
MSNQFLQAKQVNQSPPGHLAALVPSQPILLFGPTSPASQVLPPLSSPPPNLPAQSNSPIKLAPVATSLITPSREINAPSKSPNSSPNGSLPNQ